MPLFRGSLGQAVVVLSIFTTGSAEQCFYPDGTLSNETPCSSSPTGSSCCAASAFCLDNGLCFESGLVQRGGCTDETWGSAACAKICKNENSNGSIAITPCATSWGASTFVCGLNNGRCSNDENTFVLASSNLVLRPAQVSAIVAPILNETSDSHTANGTATYDGYYTTGQMAGLGAGLGIPLVLTACFTLYLWNKHRHQGPKTMYQLPDSEAIRDWKSPVAPPAYAMRPTVPATPLTRNGSDLASIRTVTPSSDRHAPPHVQSLPARYQSEIKGTSSGGARTFIPELDGQPVGSAFRFESGGSQRATRSLNNRAPPLHKHVGKF